MSSYYGMKKYRSIKKCMYKFAITNVADFTITLHKLSEALELRKSTAQVLVFQ